MTCYKLTNGIALENEQGKILAVLDTEEGIKFFEITELPSDAEQITDDMTYWRYLKMIQKEIDHAMQAERS